MADLVLILQNAAALDASHHQPAGPIRGSSKDTCAAIDAARTIAQSSLVHAKRTLSAVGRPAAGTTTEASAKRIHRSRDAQQRRIAPRLRPLGSVINA
eukprot:2270761-Heterocapsa_arctica.AAC.1